MTRGSNVKARLHAKLDGQQASKQASRTSGHDWHCCPRQSTVRSGSIAALSSRVSNDADGRPVMQKQPKTWKSASSPFSWDLSIAGDAHRQPCFVGECHGPGSFCSKHPAQHTAPVLPWLGDKVRSARVGPRVRLDVLAT